MTPASYRLAVAASLLGLAAALPAAAVTLDAPLKAPLVTAPGVDLAYSEAGSSASLIILGMATGFDGVPGFTTGNLSLFFEYALDDPYAISVPGAFQVDDGSTILLSGSVTEAADIDNGLVLQLAEVGGAQAGAFAASPLATLTFADGLAGTFASEFSGMDGGVVDVVIGNPGAVRDDTPSQVPLPGGLPLMLGVCAGAALLRVRSRRSEGGMTIQSV